MTPEERSLLERTYNLTEENNAILRGIRRTGRISMIMRIAYWVVIIGFSVGAYYLIQPYASLLTSFYGSGANDIKSAQSAADSLKDLFR
jgi:hypothetical protein